MWGNILQATQQAEVYKGFCLHLSTAWVGRQWEFFRVGWKATMDRQDSIPTPERWERAKKMLSVTNDFRPNCHRL